MPGRILQSPVASCAVVPPPACLPPDPECSNDSIGPPRSTPTVNRSRFGLSPSRPCASLEPAAATFWFSFFRNRPTSSASTSFVSRCPVLLDLVRFAVGSLFFPELLCFFKVDLLIHFDCTVECADHW